MSCRTHGSGRFRTSTPTSAPLARISRPSSRGCASTISAAPSGRAWSIRVHGCLNRWQSPTRNPSSSRPLTTAFLVLLEQLAPTERAVFLLREVFELDFDEIARSVGKSEANTRQILTRARGRLRDSRPRFTVSRRESEAIVRRFREACVTGNLEELMTVLHTDAEFVADGGGKALAATSPVLGADRIAEFVIDVVGKLRWSESDPQLVTINGAPGLLLRHPIAGNGTYSFDIADGRIRAIYVVRNPDKLRRFLEHTH